MKRNLICIASTLICVLLSGNIKAFAANEAVKNVSKYEINVNEKLYVPFEKSAPGYFEKGFTTGYGSGITFKGLDSNGNPQFYAISDRGPNADAPNYTLNDQTLPAKFFPSPGFTPSIGIITIKNGQAIVDSDIKIKDKSGKNISGLPLESGLVGSTGEVALNVDLKVMGYDREGLDTEGIAVDKQGNFWICDEYGPFISKLDKDGKILKKYAPTQGLPEVLKHRIPNRGFEGLTITPSGKVLAVVQSVLDIDGKTGKTATFTRIIELDPATEKVKTYAYPINSDDYSSPKNCKIGDIYAITDKTVLLIEQGELKDKSMSNLIYKVDLSDATDITNLKHEEKELEFVSDAALLKDVKFAKKEKFIDLRALGWTAEKAEGLCLFNNSSSLAVICDNDFGLALSVSDKKTAKPSITDYIYNPEKKEYTYKTTSTPEYKIVENNEPTALWIIDLNNPLKN